jgi:hypothetical protein
MNILITAILLFFIHSSTAQNVSASLPKTIDKNDRYLFYLMVVLLQFLVTTPLTMAHRNGDVMNIPIF